MNETKFQELLERFQKSGLDVKSFCANEAISPSTFYYWKKKHKNTGAPKEFVQLLVDRSKTPDSQEHLYKSHHPGENEDFIFELVFPNNTRLRIKNNMELQQLRALIHLYD